MDKKWWTLIAVCAGMFMLLLDVTIVVVAQPAIQEGLHASFTEVQWVLDAYALTLASLLLVPGTSCAPAARSRPAPRPRPRMLGPVRTARARPVRLSSY